MCLCNQIKVAYLDVMRRATPAPGSEGQKEPPHYAHRRFLSCLVFQELCSRVVIDCGLCYRTFYSELDP